MSTLKVNNLQVGQDSTATNNLTWFQPGSPDGTIRLGSGNAGSATTKFTFDKDGNLTCVGDITANSIIAPIEGTLDDWIVHAGDTNTKFGFPAVDQFQVQAGGTTGLTVYDTNVRVPTKLGINGAAPQTPLDVVADGSGYAINVRGRSSDNVGEIRFTSNDYGSLYSVLQTGATYLSFQVGSNTNALRITSDGFIGINKADPKTGLTINKFGTQPVVNGNTYPYPAGNWSTVWNTNTANNTDYWAGFVGGYDISSATVNISLAPNTYNFNTQAGIYIAGEAQSTSTADFTIGKLIGGSQGGISASAGNQRATKSEMFRITSGGDVVIGHNAANARLHIASGTSSAVGDATNPAVQIGNTTNYRFAIHTTNEQAIIANKNGDDGIAFHTKTASGGSFGEALGIRSGGIVQIGGATANSADVDTSNTKLTIKQSANSQEDGIYIERSGERRGFYIYVGGALSQNDALGIVSNQLGGDTAVLSIDRGGDIVVGAGNIKMPNGKGIDFSNNTDGGETSTFTTLEDYEEGTFTPHFEIETRGAGDSPVDGVQGRYVKVGNVVTCHYVIQLNGTPNQRSTSRAWEIHGFPYTSKDGNSSGQMGGNQRVTGYETATYGPDGHFVFRLFNNTTYGRLEFIEHNYNGTRNASPMMLDNAQVIGTITYQSDG